MPMSLVRRSVPIKGMNTVIAPRVMSEEYSPELLNLWYNDGILLRKRLGVSVRNVTPAPATGIKDYLEYSVGVTTELFIQDKAGGVHKDTGASYVAQTPVFTGTIGHALLKNFMIVGDGVTPAQKYDGAVWTPITTPPTPVSTTLTANIFHTFKGRCYAAGDPALPLTVYVSDSFTSSGVDYWDSGVASAAGERGYMIDCSGDVSSGDRITGISNHRGMLIVFCTNHIFAYSISESSVSGWSASLFKGIAGEGCVTQKSIQPIGEEILFLSANGFKKLTVSLVQGDSQVNDLSSPINNTVKAQAHHISTVIDDIRSTYNPRYGLYLCTIGLITWAYQPQFEGWFKWQNVNGTLYTDAALITHLGNLYAYELVHNVFQDETAPNVFMGISTKWTPAPFRGLSLEHKPRWRRFEVVFTTDTPTDTLTIRYYADLSLNNAVTEQFQVIADFVLPEGGFSGKAEIPITGRSELLSADIFHTSNTDLKYNLIEVYMNDGGIR